MQDGQSPREEPPACSTTVGQSEVPIEHAAHTTDLTPDANAATDMCEHGRMKRTEMDIKHARQDAPVPAVYFSMS